VYLPEEGWRAIIGDSSLFAYQLWMVAGALAGLHLERMHDWIMGHQVLVLAAVPVGCAALLWSYWAQVPSLGVLEAATPLQPSMIVWSTIMLGALYLAAVRLSRWRSRRARRVFAYLAQLSFGIYLAHPLVLDLVLSFARRLGVFGPHKWLVVVSYVLVTAITVTLCALLHRTPLSRALMGRARRSARPRAAEPAGAAEAPEHRLAAPSATR
jgi:peptidoglycan/LPS O-acetylase OafA/YrhL